MTVPAEGIRKWKEKSENSDPEALTNLGKIIMTVLQSKKPEKPEEGRYVMNWKVDGAQEPQNIKRVGSDEDDIFSIHYNKLKRSENEERQSENPDQLCHGMQKGP